MLDEREYQDYLDYMRYLRSKDLMTKIKQKELEVEQDVEEE